MVLERGASLYSTSNKEFSFEFTDRDSLGNTFRKETRVKEEAVKVVFLNRFLMLKNVYD